MSLPLSIAFRSGMSRGNDLRGAIDAGVAVGVVAGELNTGATVNTLPRYLDRGGYVFIDSGAFNAVKSGEAPDFPRVLDLYRFIAGMTDRPEHLYVVAPDRVGDQEATLELLTTYRKEVRELIDLGARVIVPVQKGGMPVATMLERAKAALGTDRFIVGVPSNKAALSQEDCASLTHHAFHILGRVQANDEHRERLDALRGANPEAVFTADANWLRSRMGLALDQVDAMKSDLRQLPDRARERARSARELGITRALRADAAWGAQPAGAHAAPEDADDEVSEARVRP